MNQDTLDELAAFGHPDEATVSARTLTELVERNPMPAVLAAAAAGAGLMALVTLMARREPDPLAAMPLVSPRAFDYDALKRQVADLADRLSKAAPVDTARQQVEQASGALADGWSAVREQALDLLNRFEPQAGAAVKVARDNPLWTALVVGAVGALVGSQLLGKSREAAASQSDPSAAA